MFSLTRHSLAPVAVAVVALGLLPACVPLPVRVASGVAGVVVDAASGQPVPGAVVVVSFEGSYDEVLPERERLGHREALTDRDGRFHTDALVVPGMTAWPWLRVQPRVVAVFAADYRCASNVLPPADGPVHVALSRAADSDDQRETCRAVSAPYEQAPRYTRLWRGLHTAAEHSPAPRPSPEEARTLAARGLLGFGANCHGPVLDVSLDPLGERAGLLVREGERVAVELASLSGAQPSERLVHASRHPTRRLAWSGDGELFLLEASFRLDAPVAGSDAAARPLTRQLVWRPERAALPASRAPFASLADDALSQDDTGRRYAGRSFEILQSLDPETGLPTDQLHVTEADGVRHEIALPGEACREGGRFGRPHYLLSGDGRTGVDLRYIDGRCRAVAIDLVSGDWRALENADSEPAACAATRRMPRSQLELALRGYLHEVENRISESGLDPHSAFTLLFADDGRTTIRAVDAAGARHRISAPRLPVATPLTSLEISVVAPPPAGTPSVEAGPADDWEPL